MVKKKYFWREKNAENCKTKGLVIMPTKDELKAELTKKLWQKLDRVNLIFDKKARLDYWEKDEKPKNYKLEDYSEEELQRKIGANVAVDFLQLVRDLCQFYGIKILNKNLPKSNLSLDEIKIDLKDNIMLLEKEITIEKAIRNIFKITISLINLLNLDFEKVEHMRKEKEEKQGSFLNGKYVIIDMESKI